MLADHVSSPVGSEQESGRSGSGNRVITRVMGNQALFQAGNSLTTGSFFNYFVNGFHPSAFWLAVLMILPETMQSLCLLTRRWWTNRKSVWLASLVIGRFSAMLIPCALLFPTTESQQLAPILFVAGCTAVWYFAQGIAYVNYLSWLSDLAPSTRWGTLFSRRQMAGLLIGIGMPLGVLMLRRKILAPLPDDAERWSYAVLFTAGGILTICSVLPMLSLPDVPMAATAPAAKRPWREIWSNARFRYLLASRWTAAFFQGLTQAVLFKYAVDFLKIPIETYFSMISLMLLIQLPLSWSAGRLSDAGQDRAGMFWGLLIVSLAMPCWLMATAVNWWWLVVAYACWGAFALVNVCGTNLCLKLSPRSENLRQLTLYEQVSGFIAGLAGLLGGALLDQMLHGVTETDARIAAFQTLIVVSWIGRTAAPLWLLGMREVHSPHRA